LAPKRALALAMLAGSPAVLQIMHGRRKALASLVSRL
jgi:hypothetical protein